MRNLDLKIFGKIEKEQVYRPVSRAVGRGQDWDALFTVIYEHDYRFTIKQALTD